MRDTDLQALRPSIPSIDSERAVSPAEQFQNATLRPILKLQNELLLAAYRNYLQLRKNPLEGLTPGKQRAFVEHSVRTDLKFRNFLVGLMAGHFTLAEWEAFRQNEAELVRRTVGLIVQRLQDQMGELR